MPVRRTYAEHGDACIAAHAMDLIGDRWSLIVVRELVFGPRRFNELLDALHGITPAVLTGRLRELEEAGIVGRRTVPAPARVGVYELSEWGQGLEPVIRTLGRWAQPSPQRPTGRGLTPSGVIMAMRTIAPSTPVPRPIELQLRFHDRRSQYQDEHDFRLAWSATDLTIEIGTRANPQATVSADSTVWAQTVFGGLGLADAERDHGLVISGDRNAVRRLIKAFTRPN
jgi:DNA-binding HxlR family transcriptional regulator